MKDSGHDGDEQCYDNNISTFEELKSRSIDSRHLYEWNAPIDTIHNYEKYLSGNDLTFANHRYCNCSPNWFGIRCQYSFGEANEQVTFDEIIISQFKRKKPLYDNYEIVNHPSMLTCYEGLQCDSVICLDWQQICDRQINCKKGEDEPEECLLLELNECQNNEYRCRFGGCIPKSFLIDVSYDCMDLTDETTTYYGQQNNSDCYSTPLPMCDFHLCNKDKFSCSDGECMALTRDSVWCNNGRDLFFNQKLLLSSLSSNEKNSSKITAECWLLMLCTTGKRYTDLFGYNYSTCQCSLTSSDNLLCGDYFRKHCPKMFMFQTVNNFLYPFVQFLYQTSLNDSLLWWKPTHFCYNRSLCRAVPFTSTMFINDMMCISTQPVNYDHLRWFKNIFIACSTTPTSALINDKRLFYCNMSKTLISIYRLDEQYENCYLGEDSYYDDNVRRILNLTDYFKCHTVDQWWPRPLIRLGRCSDKSDLLYVGQCTTASDFGCQYLRGIYSPPINYIFRENCNHQVKLLYSIDNETDETSCNAWPPAYCDGYWNVINGEDELNCTNTTLSYITHRVFQCNLNEHYCVYLNGTMGCLSKERAGDGSIDCLGGADERAIMYDSHDRIHEFYCSNTARQFIDDSNIGSSAEYLLKNSLCDNMKDCPHGDDELMCQWKGNVTGSEILDFMCHNGTSIDREQQCNDIIDCHPNAEDEWFCDLYKLKDLKFALNKIEAYPSVNIDSTYLPNIAGTRSYVASRPTNDISYESMKPLDNWFCNRGIIVRKRSSTAECFCPPSYYGRRCEYQSERLFVILRLDRPVSLSGHQNQQYAIRLMAYLVLDDIVIHYQEILHATFMKQMFYLNYPRPAPKPRGNWTVRLDAFAVTKYDVKFQAAWLFNVPFSFLPVNQLALHLTLNDSETCRTLLCIHGLCRKYLNSPNHEYCQCEDNWSGKHCNVTTTCSCAEGSKCVYGYFRSICVCPLGRMGSECHARFNPCDNIQCQNGGTCMPFDEREKKFVCSCSDEFYGDYCELSHARIDIQFSSSLSFRESQLSTVIIVYFLELSHDSDGYLSIQNRYLYKQEQQLNKPLRIFNKNQQNLTAFVLLEIFSEPSIVNYYIAAIVKQYLTNLNTIVDQSNRCPYVDELLRNETIRQFPLIKKVKYYRYICEMDFIGKCFHDEAYLCFCNSDHQPDCLFYPHESAQCAIDYCQNNGRCVQNNFNGVWDFGCVCSECTYGSLCQLTTSEYAFSLDMMLGQDIRANVSLSNQSFFIKFVLALFILMLLFGFISNFLSLIIFKKQLNVQQYGCGVYLFCLPIVGQFGLTVFVGRFIYVLGTQLYNVNHRSAARWSCVSLEYFLSTCPMLFDWLTACVAVERSVSVIKGVAFKKLDSVWWAKRVICSLLIIVFLSSWHIPFIHDIIDDPRATALHVWCVIRFPRSSLRYYRLTVNLINLIIPGLISVVATAFTLHKQTRLKQALLANDSKEKGYLKSLKKQLPFYGSPLALVVFSLVRLIFSFTLICITKQWQKYVYLTAYFISFTPLMGTFPIFVLSAKIYRTELENFRKQLVEKLRGPSV
ncbi:unnamed protein product [Adineta ricciae]|uniref:EGF-like domain-containing protein n=1 Tax=Adineta ricciae TaxID=249248 RepID=A0A815Y907_ADIRI|nr:unnamed protein product [Adineta ricciae]